MSSCWNHQLYVCDPQTSVCSSDTISQSQTLQRPLLSGYGSLVLPETLESPQISGQNSMTGCVRSSSVSSPTVEGTQMPMKRRTAQRRQVSRTAGQTSSLAVSRVNFMNMIMSESSQMQKTTSPIEGSLSDFHRSSPNVWVSRNSPVLCGHQLGVLQFNSQTIPGVKGDITG